ncbi:protein tweety homolog 2-like isoform X1 [Polyodon spathula]|uniref:protein tweety homolog 2-like isoform X1 n=2 Tax=Polyodon spathula TaxID=7913 RepID=UPI001B7F4C5A|nr:protein tweety homolog 2-like isoform X1 [Polyodon spathula]
MSTARVDYIAPWWTYWLHNFPHVNLRFKPVDSSFNPQEENYQQSLIFLVCVVAAGLGLNLLFLAIYLGCLCCCRSDKEENEEETKRPKSCCVTWTAVIAGLLCCAAVGVGFYGNSEMNDGVYQLAYSLYHANHTLNGVDTLVSGTIDSMQSSLKQHLARLDEIFAMRGDYIQTLRFIQQMADNIILQLTGLPDWGQNKVDLARIADQTSYVEYYRWLTYLLLLILDLVTCLVACLGLAKQSRWLLTTMMTFGVLTLILSWASLGVDTATAVGTSDFCVAPDKFIMNLTRNAISTDTVHYYLYCSQSMPNPFQQAMTIYQRSVTTMQIQIQGLLQFAVPVFPTAERDLLGIQQLLNGSEASLHQLTALLDCRSLHKDYLDALIGVCYDGVEGLLYLSLFSLLAATAFCAMLCAIPHAWRHFDNRDRDYDDIDEDDPFNPQARRIAAHSPVRGQIHSFCSYSSSMGSQSSLQHPAQAVSNAPVSEYMNQSVLFGGNPRYENVPLIGRGSPPPSYSPSMRATYLSVTDNQLRHYGSDLQV